jgi:ABC-2 type transport system permease protein
MTSTSSINLIRSELRKVASTSMPLTFLAVLVVLAAINGVAVVIGTDMDGSKTFISTGADQQSLIAFAANALMIAGLFGAIAAAREYAHNTVIGTYLNTPKRARALAAQFTAIGAAGAVLGVAGSGLTAGAVALSLPFTEYGFMVPTGDLIQVLAASGWAGAVGAVLGAGIGTAMRNTGGAVAATVVALVIAPSVVVQLAADVASWVPGTLAIVVAGVVDHTTVTQAVVALAAWAAVPAAAALWLVQRRDVV